MTDLMAKAPSENGGKIKKEEEQGQFFAGSAFDSLDILATIATQELKINKNSSENGESEETEDDSEDSKAYAKGSVQPKKLAEMDTVNMEQVRSMSANTLVRIFAETDFDEMKRMYCYSCFLMPGECKAQFKSFGNESKAKKDIRVHLEKHVDELVSGQRTDFVAEPIMARKRRIKDLTSYVATRPPMTRRRGLQIKEEDGLEKENMENMVGRRKKEDSVPLLAEATNDQELKRYRVKAEGTEEEEMEDADYEEEEFREGPEKEKRLQTNSEELEQPMEVKVERMERRDVRRSGEEVHIAIDEDHCYAFNPCKVKAEYWPGDLYNTATTTFTATQEEEDNTYTALKAGSPPHVPQDLASEEAIQAIQTCPVIMEEELCFQDGSKVGDVASDAEYVKEYVIDQEEERQYAPPQQVHREPVQPVEAPEYTTIVYQDKLGAEQFYTETIVTDVVSSEDYYGAHQQHILPEVEKPPIRIKNKRTVAAVSSEDKRRALNAMEELRARGATTDDLMCRLCDPARPFTAYSTLLTHYRSHAGLRPFECSLCGATFTRQHSLNYHLMTHANQTRFTCPHCNRKFRHPTHFKEHVKKHGEVVQFLCNFCPASLSTQSQYRKHLKMRHNKTIDIMGNIIDSPPDAKDKDRAKRKRRVVKPEEEEEAILGKKKRRRRTKTDSTEISQYEEVVHSSSVDQATGAVIYEETVPMSESEQMYEASEDLQQEEGLAVTPQSQFMPPIAQYREEPGAQYMEQYVAAASNTGQQPEPKQYQAEQVQQKSPMIFVVPNSGQKPEVARKPVVVSSAEQKRPVMVSKLPANTTQGAGVDARIKQGVIAQINGQKVLLVPKKKNEGGVRVSGTSQAPGGQATQSNARVTVVSAPSADCLLRPPACLTEIDPNTVQSNNENMPENTKTNILEQAMHEVFPSDIDFTDSQEETVTTAQVGDDLYNPMRSPLKNRNKILCEVLGIQS